MNQELEDYMLFKMFSEKYGEETFEKAKEIYSERIGFKNLPFYKKLFINGSLGIYNSKEFKKVKKIQSGLILEIIWESQKEEEENIK